MSEYQPIEKRQEETANKIMAAFEGDGWPGVDYIKEIIAEHDQPSIKFATRVMDVMKETKRIEPLSVKSVGSIYRTMFDMGVGLDVEDDIRETT